MWKEQIQSIMEGQRILSYIFDHTPSLDSDTRKPSDQYLSWKKDDSLIKNWIRGTFTEEVWYLVSGLSTGEVSDHPITQL